jgi:KipI family sensor histidine kinase inhibitor
LSRYPRVLPVGDAALTIELDEADAPGVNARVRALDRALARQPFAGLLETVPCLRSLLVCLDPTKASVDEAGHLVARLAAAPAEPASGGEPRVLETVYGGADGPDLAEVAARTRMSEADVIAAHSSAEYTAAMLGFMPGFAYLSGLPPELQTPRRATPRERVPRGSVAIAGRHTGVYPARSPGGWNLIGRTSVALFDPLASPPALIQPGDRVRFRPVPSLPPEPAPRPPAVAGDAVLVLDPGLLTTVQDGGRRGHRRSGVSWTGAVDAAALAAANAAVGNLPDAAGLECTIEGPALQFRTTVRFALAGADFGAVLERADLGAWPAPLGHAVLARAGNTLRLGQRRHGCRGYVAFAGGIDVPLVLGSRSTDLAGGFGGYQGRRLAEGDRFGLGRASGDGPGGSATPAPEPTASAPSARVVLGPQCDHFDESTLQRFLSETWRVLGSSDRIGCRLSGPRLEHRGATEIPTDGMVPGCIQVPPDGQPIVMLADGPTTGGYPKIATVVTADLPLIAQLVPGEGTVRFRAAR